MRESATIERTPITRPAATRPAAIASVGAAAPERRLSSAELERTIGLGPGWIESRTGVRERRIAAPGDTLTGLAADAGRRALDAAGASAADLDLVLVATLTPDQRMPNAAPLVAERLGASAAGAIDLGAACTGFVSGLALAAATVEAGRADSVLVIGADLLSGVTDFGDRRTGGLFGDGAGAVLVRAGGEGEGAIGPSVLGSDGGRADLIELDQGTEARIRMKGHDTFREAVDRLSSCTLEALDLTGWELGGVDLFVYHQANGRILAAVGERLGLEPARVADYVGPFGNTSSATIPIALAEALAEGRIEPGSRLVLAAFGAGATWGATTVVWGGSV